MKKGLVIAMAALSLSLGFDAMSERGVGAQ
jgi:hypothetical protein